MIKCCSKKNKIWTVPLECLKNQSKPIKFTSGRVNKGLFPLYMIEELRFRGILYAAKLMILELAAKTGIDQADISKVEHGKLNISFRTMQRLAEGLGKMLKIELVDP